MTVKFDERSKTLNRIKREQYEFRAEFNSIKLDLKARIVQIICKDGFAIG